MNPIQTLQLMLDSIAKTQSGLIRTADTGIYDETTLEAVLRFQKLYGLKLTGIVDQLTWDTIYSAYESERLMHEPPPPLSFVPTYEGSNQNHGIQSILQIIVHALGTVFSNADELQRPYNPESSCESWRVLAQLHRAAIARNAYGTFPL